MEKTYNYRAYENDHRVVLRKTNYVNNNALAIIMVCVNENGEEAEEYGMVSVNLDFGFLPNKRCIFVDTNNMREVAQWLKENNLGRFNGLSGESGYCRYPMFEFDQKVLDEMLEY